MSLLSASVSSLISGSFLNTTFLFRLVLPFCGSVLCQQNEDTLADNKPKHRILMNLCMSKIALTIFFATVLLSGE